MASAKEQLSKYEKAFKKYQDLVTNKSSFSDLIERRLGEQTGYNKDLIQQQNRLLERTFALPAQLREEYSRSPIRDPRAQEALIASRRANLGTRLGSVVDLLNARKQAQSSIIRSALGAYKDRMRAAGNQADQAYNLYQQLYAEEEAERQRREREKERRAQKRNYEEYLNSLISNAQEGVYDRAFGGESYRSPSRSRPEPRKPSLTSRLMQGVGRGLGSASRRIGDTGWFNKFKNTKLGGKYLDTIGNYATMDRFNKLPSPFRKGFVGGVLGR